MITLHTIHGTKMLVNPSHIVLIKESSNTFGEPLVEVYHGAAKAPLSVKESLDEVQMLLHQFYKKTI